MNYLFNRFLAFFKWTEACALLSFIQIFGLAITPCRADSQSFGIDTFLQNQMRNDHIPAVSVAVIEKGKVVFLQAYGKANIEYHVKNTPATAFQLASCTKLVSSTAIMTLVQDGLLDLNERVTHYLPQAPASWQDMKVIDLLAHQSGISDLLAYQKNFNSSAAALDTAMARPLEFAPGTKTAYGGGDYAVVMAIVEKLSGMPFTAFLRERLLNKIGMKHTLYNNMEQDFIYRTYDTISFASTVYKWNKERQSQQVFSMLFPSWTYPAGGIFSSIDDLAKWAVALDKHTILGAGTEALMWQAATLRNGSDAPFGVGWIVASHAGEKATGHSGGPALSDIVRLPNKQITVIVLTNQLELRPTLAMKVLDLYLAHKK